MTSPAWVPWYWGDYLRDTQELTVCQHGAYFLLMAHYYTHGALPENNAALRAIAKCSPWEWPSIRKAIAPKFRPGWKHKRIEEELEKQRRISALRKLAGARGGRAKRHKQRQLSQRTTSKRSK
jgi:uncharacterized protein YdaU (DUF1376 family)